MIREILQYKHPILQSKSEVVIFPLDGNIKRLIQDLLDTVSSIDDNAVGLSAPQIGELKQVFVFRKLYNQNLYDSRKNKTKKNTNIWEVVINPIITYKSDEMSTMLEGCLSINKGSIFGEVTRPKIIHIEYFNKRGKQKKIIAKNFMSHVIQHEIDHLNGILFLDYIKDFSKLYTIKDLEQNDTKAKFR
ncbi:MAG: peptide deformylase [Candidatus Dojkabacteria bacterium]|nr:peptide deformylase [Candidatus Dojkabacteria bacterium]